MTYRYYRKNEDDGIKHVFIVPDFINADITPFMAVKDPDIMIKKLQEVRPNLLPKFMEGTVLYEMWEMTLNNEVFGPYKPGHEPWVSWAWVFVITKLIHDHDACDALGSRPLELDSSFTSNDVEYIKNLDIRVFDFSNLLQTELDTETDNYDISEKISLYFKFLKMENLRLFSNDTAIQNFDKTEFLRNLEKFRFQPRKLESFMEDFYSTYYVPFFAKTLAKITKNVEESRRNRDYTYVAVYVEVSKYAYFDVPFFIHVICGVKESQADQLYWGTRGIVAKLIYQWYKNTASDGLTEYAHTTGYLIDPKDYSLIYNPNDKTNGLSEW